MNLDSAALVIIGAGGYFVEAYSLVRPTDRFLFLAVACYGDIRPQYGAAGAHSLSWNILQGQTFSADVYLACTNVC